MRKGKITMIITIGIACLALSTIMSMQFKIVNTTDIAELEDMREEELEEELAKWKTKLEETNLELESTNIKIDEYNQNLETDTEAEALLTQELEQVNEVLGTTNVQGQGVIITLKDKQENDDLLRNLDANDLLVIVNSLKVAEVEAISINDERIINMTDIVDINNSYIKINGDRVVAPYVIKAIGNQSYIESVLLSSGGYLDYLEKLGFEITIENYELLTINAYDQDINVKYID